MRVPPAGGAPCRLDAGTRARTAPLILPVAVLLFGLAGIVIDAVRDGRVWLGVNNGVILYEGVEMAEGARLYVDWQDTNPPSIYLLAWLTAALARAAALPVTLTYYLLVIALAVAGMAVLSSVLRAEDWSVSGTTAVLLAYVLFVFHAGYQALDFAEREHVFALLYVPFVFAASSVRPLGRRYVPWFFLLGFFCMMKPHFLAGVIVVLLVAAAAGRRPALGQLVALGIGALAPLAGLYLHSAESFSAFFRDVAALHLEGGYGYYKVAWAEALRTGPIALGLATALVTALAYEIGRRGWSSRCRIATYLAALAVMWAGVLHQQKFWDYQFVPAAGLVMVGAVILASAAIERIEGSRREALRLLLVVVVAVAAVAGTGRFITATAFATRTPLVERLLTLVDRGSTVLAVSPHVTGVFDPERDTVRALGPWPGHFLLPAAADTADPAERERALRQYATELRERIVEARPALVLFSTDESLFAPGVSPYELFVSRYDVLPEGWYEPVDEALLLRLQLAGWKAFTLDSSP